MTQYKQAEFKFTTVSLWKQDEFHDDFWSKKNKNKKTSWCGVMLTTSPVPGGSRYLNVCRIVG
jgi:hypothetical protein